jgi:hypothetical protein
MALARIAWSRSVTGGVSRCVLLKSDARVTSAVIIRAAVPRMVMDNGSDTRMALGVLQ